MVLVGCIQSHFDLAPDHTMYLYLTPNSTDYHNLMRVYLDASLKPLLREADFKQEGHRLEFENLTGMFV